MLSKPINLPDDSSRYDKNQLKRKRELVEITV